jgi:hypothetical protein
MGRHSMANDRYRRGGREERRGKERSSEEIEADVKRRLKGETTPVSTGGDADRSGSATEGFATDQRQSSLRYGGDSRHEGDHVPREQASSRDVVGGRQGERPSQGNRASSESPQRSGQRYEQSSRRDQDRRGQTSRKSNQRGANPQHPNARQSNQRYSDPQHPNPRQSNPRRSSQGRHAGPDRQPEQTRHSEPDRQPTRGTRHSLEYGGEARHEPNHAGRPNPGEQFGEAERRTPQQGRERSSPGRGEPSPERRPSPQQSHQQTPPKQPHQQPTEHDRIPGGRSSPRQQSGGGRRQATGSRSSRQHSTERRGSTNEPTYSQRLEESQRRTEGQREPEEMRRGPDGPPERGSQERGGRGVGARSQGERGRRESSTRGSESRRYGGRRAQFEERDEHSDGEGSRRGNRH